MSDLSIVLSMSCIRRGRWEGGALDRGRARLKQTGVCSLLRRLRYCLHVRSCTVHAIPRGSHEVRRTEERKFFSALMRGAIVRA